MEKKKVDIVIFGNMLTTRFIGVAVKYIYK